MNRKNDSFLGLLFQFQFLQNAHKWSKNLNHNSSGIRIVSALERTDGAGTIRNKRTRPPKKFYPHIQKGGPTHECSSM